MATFTKLEQFADHLKYKALLKAAVAKAKTTPLRFVYVEKYKFGDKVFPLLLTDMEPALLNDVKKAAGMITAVGKCRLNEDNEIAFEIETGKLDRNKLKVYLATFPGMQVVAIPAAEKAAGSTPPPAPPKPVQTPVATQATGAAPQRATIPNPPAVAAVSAAFDRLVPLAKQAAADHPDQKSALTETLGAAQRFIKAGSVEEAQKAMAKATAMVESLKSAKKPDTPGADPKVAMAAWQSARNQAIAPLKQLIAEIKDMADPEGDAAITLIQELQAKLDVTPSTQEETAAFERLLKSDPGITDVEAPNGLGVTVNIRKPLLEALAKLKTQLPA